MPQNKVSDIVMHMTLNTINGVVLYHFTIDAQ